MPNWYNRITLRDLMTCNKDHESVQKSMTVIADRIKAKPFFSRFDVAKFYRIPKGDGVIQPVDYANKLLSRMWDFCDENRIWVEL
jgi:hypothetical protein